MDDAELDRLRRAAFSRSGGDAELRALRHAEAQVAEARMVVPAAEAAAAAAASAVADPEPEPEPEPEPAPVSRRSRIVVAVLVVAAVLAVVVVALLRPGSSPASPPGILVLPPSPEPSPSSSVVVDVDTGRFLIAAPAPGGGAPIDPADPAVQQRLAETFARNGVDQAEPLQTIDGWAYFGGPDSDTSVCFFRFQTTTDEGTCVPRADFELEGVSLPIEFLDADDLDSVNRSVSGQVTWLPDGSIRTSAGP